MSTIWIIGRETEIASNGHKYITEPFIAFATEADADAACDLVEKISGERPRKATAGFMVVTGAGREVVEAMKSATPDDLRRKSQ